MHVCTRWEKKSVNSAFCIFAELILTNISVYSLSQMRAVDSSEPPTNYIIRRQEWAITNSNYSCSLQFHF